MATIWFTADLHLDHPQMAQIRGLSTAGMTRCLIRAWQEQVRPEDTVYLLGDFAWKNGEELLKELPGRITLIKGNHDYKRPIPPGFCLAYDTLMIQVDNQKIFLSHYPHIVWPEKHRGAWHLYGHMHGTLAETDDRLAMDVGVDTNNFQLYSFGQIEDLMAAKANRYAVASKQAAL